MNPRSPAVGFVLVCVFLDVLGVGLIIPVLPSLVGQFTADAQHQSYWYGALVASYGLMQFVFSPVLGALSDRLGRRPPPSMRGLRPMCCRWCAVRSSWRRARMPPNSLGWPRWA